MPRDLKLAGKTETFTITVRFDTKELYGELSGTRTVTLTENP